MIREKKRYKNEQTEAVNRKRSKKHTPLHICLNYVDSSIQQKKESKKIRTNPRYGDDGFAETIVDSKSKFNR